GNWINVNAEAIYSTRAIEPFKTENICLSQQKDTKAVYAIYLEKEEEKGLPKSFVVEDIFVDNNATISMLGVKGSLKWKNSEKGVEVFIPEKIRKNLPCELAWAVKISKIK
ncbi:MAG: alpha-L-fucosidase C-terminal domain-containing protein, partial [Draconibacterium sp.]|nr:alpha-L-fucosidase C-terminal domain-containing protein [Draconibacterium sp.]